MLLKVSTYWGIGQPQGHQLRSRLLMLSAYFLSKPVSTNRTIVRDCGVRNLHRCLSSSESGAKTRLIVQHRLPCVLITTLYSCSEKVNILLIDAPTNYISTICLIPTNINFARIWRWTAFGWPCALHSDTSGPADECVQKHTKQLVDCLCSYLPLVFFIFYGGWTPVEETIVDV